MRTSHLIQNLLQLMKAMGLFQKPALAILLCAIAANTSAQPGNYTDPATVCTYVKGMLYWPNADATNRNVAAFRYKHLLYEGSGVIAPVGEPITTPRIAITKHCPPQPTPHSSELIFTGTVSNPGDVTLVNVYVVNNQHDHTITVIKDATPERIKIGLADAFCPSATALRAAYTVAVELAHGLRRGAQALRLSGDQPGDRHDARPGAAGMLPISGNCEAVLASGELPELRDH